MKVATLNIQNLFHRDRSHTEKPFSKNARDWFNELDGLMSGHNLGRSKLDRIRELSFLLGFEKSYNSPFAVMRRKSGDLYLKGSDHFKELKACELTNWNGWTVLQNTPIDPIAIKNKAKLIAEIDPDILLLQEIEDRASLEEFSSTVLPEFNCGSFTQTHTLPRKELKGMEMGILLKKDYSLDSVKIHSFYFDSVKNPLLGQEYVEYRIVMPSGEILTIIAVHLQIEDQDKATADTIRKRQVWQIANLYQEILSKGNSKVIIGGTFNVVSYCDSLSPLLRHTDLNDIAKHQSFNVDIDKGRDADYFRLGAYRMGVNIKQKDYLLLSPELFFSVKNSGLNRKGVWPSKKPVWSVYSTMGNKNQEASEHPAIWGDLEI